MCLEVIRAQKVTVLSLIDDFISKLDIKEQKQALEVVATLHKIFDILETNGYLRDTLRGDVERTKFSSIMKNSNKLFAAYNMLFNVFEKRDMSKKFAEHNKSFGFYEDGLAYLFLSESIATVLRTAELFRNCFLFVLKTSKKRSKDGFWSKMTLGDLLRQLDKVTQKKSCYLTEKMDVQLRNALAHGLFWVEGSVLVYCKDITLRKPKEIIVPELWIKAREQSKIAQCLITFIADWYHGT
jgi:hypothetical protein